MNHTHKLNITQVTLALVASIGFSASSLAADDKDFSGKIGVVNSERIFKESNMAKASQAKLQSDFSKREKDLRDDAQKIKSAAEKLDKEAAVMSDTDRVRKQRELADADRELQRKQREFTEDVNQRSFEERSKIAQKANQALKAVAEQRKLDLIVQEAAYVNPRIDVTDEVIKALNSSR
ncbi:MAG: OmpH family outer membrane protein [Polynucleobacter sp.]|nr:MAG: OmpH family outer membrane protein [Polynucleobacter sp.]